MSVDALARQLATADPAVVARFLETCDPDEAAAVEAALVVLERGRVLDLVDTFPTLPPDEAEAILETLTDEQTALLREELDVRDLEAFLAGRRAEDVRAAAEVDGCTWFSALFPSYARAGFAPHMREVWEWAWTIRRRERVRPLAAIWFRGGSKSSTAEGVTAALGARGARGYGLYVSGTQAQADRHVGTLGAMLESKRFAAAYPDMARRAVGQYGASKGWSRTRLSTAAGFTVDALGLGVEARGIRMEEERPDFIVLDDVDALSDGPAMVEKKIRLLTETILPSGSPDLVVLAIQNVIHPNSIFARLANMADTPADFLADRIISGPVPAVLDLDVQPEPTAEGGTRWTVRGGTPTWPDGFGLGAVQAAIDTYGLTAFLREGQHVVNAAPGGMFDHLTYRHADPGAVPFLVRRVCWVDPAVTNTDTSDACAIQLDGLDAAGQVWRLWSWEARSTPLRALSLAIRAAHRYGCPYVGVETDQGGDTWESVYREACRTVTTEDPERSGQALDGGEILGMETLPGFTWAKAGSTHESKVERAARMLVEYEGPRAPVHVIGTHVILEAALNRFGPKGTKPFDLTDACLVAGSAVDTAGGPVPIEHVVPGMSVWTRAGLATVAAAGRTGTGRPVYEATTGDGRKLVGTADHPVWTKEQGWTSLSECAGLTGVRPDWADSAAAAVVSVRLLPDSADVWNLEVDGPHEFFANGLLVHNCYWAWRDLRKGGTATVQAPPLAPVRAPISTPRGGGMIRVPTGRVNGASRLR